MMMTRIYIVRPEGKKGVCFDLYAIDLNCLVTLLGRMAELGNKKRKESKFLSACPISAMGSW
jgi:hypothetical protein